MQKIQNHTQDWLLFATALILSWLIPGWGFYYIRKKWSAGIVAFLMFLLVYAGGWFMADGKISAQEPYYFLCQIGAGSFTLLACIPWELDASVWTHQAYYWGMLYTSTVGILNYILVCQVGDTLLKEK